MGEERIIIKTRDLTKKYGALVAVNNLNLEIKQGEVFGLLGPNGAGKTTTILMLLGLSEPTGGTAMIEEHNCTHNPIAVKRIVGYLPDNVGFYGDLTGRQNLRFMGELNGIPPKEIEERIETLIKRVGIEYAADKKVGAYSRGMKQRLGIADVLMKDPKIVILDEPTLGIDPEGIHELMDLIKELSVKDGRTVLISSHQLYQVQQVCDRVGIFVRGNLVACGRIDELGRQVSEGADMELEVMAFPETKEMESAFKAIEGVVSITKEKDMYVIRSKTDVRDALVNAVTARSASLHYLKARGGDLDEIYRRYFAKEGGADNGKDSGKNKVVVRRKG
jgi:ABC-2 type transport system ATP-binding protein